jgi:CPA1 family monovalent cation:H+ antiporter
MIETDFFFIVLSLLVFLLAGAVLQLVSKYTRAPFTLLLVLFGVAISLWQEFTKELKFADFLAEDSFSYSFLEVMGNFTLSPEVVFYVFLPVLVFESAFNLRIVLLKQSIKAITVLAVITLLLSMSIIGFSLHYLLGLEIAAALLFGIIISATDPVAVLGTFREMGAPRRLRTIIEGESLFNDGTALVIFGILLAWATGTDGDGFSFSSGVVDFFFRVIGGIAFGAFLGFAFSKLIHMVRENRNVEMTLALVLAHATFLFAEHIHVSGIISTVVAAVILGNYGRSKISPTVLDTMQHFWDHMAFIVNSLIFILIGIAIAKSFSPDFLIPSLIAIAVVVAARFASVIPALSGMNVFVKKETEKVPLSWQLVISHGGLRGALAVVMLLLIPESYPELEILQTMTVSVIIFLFLFNSTTISWMLKKFGLMNFTPVDLLETEESHVLVAHSMKEHLIKIHKKRYISADVYQKILESYKKSEQIANRKIKNLFQKKNVFSQHELLLILKKHCLGVERKLFYQLFAAEEISEHTLVELVSSTERQKERLMLHMDQESKMSSVPFEKRIKQKEEFLQSVLGKLSHFGFIAKMILKWKRKRIIEKHERYRSRRISAWNVLKHLEELQKNGLFLEYGVLKTVTDQYKKWHENAQKKQWDIEKRHDDFLIDRKFYLTKRNCLQMERELIEGYFEQDIITQKVYTSLLNTLEKRMRKIRHDALSDEMEM